MTTRVNPTQQMTVQMVYQTSNQSMWESGQSGGMSCDSGQSMILKWSPPDQSGDGYTHLDVIGTFGGGGSLSTQGKVGFVGSANVTSGSVDIDCPVKVTLGAPTYTDAAGVFQVTTDFAIDTTAKLRTHGPDASAKLDFQFAASLSAGVKVEAFSDKLLNWHIGVGSTSNPVSASKTLVDLSADEIANLAIPVIRIPDEAPVFISQVHVPILDAANTSAGGKTLKASVEDYMLSMSLDITNLISTILEEAGIEVPPFAASLSLPGDKGAEGTTTDDSSGGEAYEVELGYALFDTKITGDVGVKQTFTFSPKPRITLHAVDGAGNTLTAYQDSARTKPVVFPVDVGTAVWYLMPPTNIVQITPDITYENEFENDTAMALSGDLDFAPYLMEVRGKVAGIKLPRWEWEPWSATLDLGSIEPLHQTCRPTLSGFPSTHLVGPTFSIVQQNMPLPGIGSVTPSVTPVLPYNQPLAAGADDNPPLTAAVCSDNKAAWDLSRDKFYLDVVDSAHLIDAVPLSSDGLTIQLNFSNNVLTPGPHSVIAVSSYDDNRVVPPGGGPDFVRRSACDFSINYLVPHIDALQIMDGSENCDSLPLGGPAVTLRVHGTGFTPQSRVLLGGAPLLVKAQPSTNDILFEVPASAQVAPGAYRLTVVNPAPGGGASNAFQLTVNSGPCTLTGLTAADGTPPALIVDDPDTLVLLAGTGFLPGCFAMVKGHQLAVTVQSSTAASVVIPASMLAHQNFRSPSDFSLSFYVQNPMVSSLNHVVTGGKSAIITAPVAAPLPYVSTVSPSAVVRGQVPPQIQVTGTGLLGPGTVSATVGTLPPQQATLRTTSSGGGNLMLPAACFRLPGDVALSLQIQYGPVPQSTDATLRVLASCFFADDDGTIYAVDTSGNLRWYKDTARNGTSQWAAGSGNAITQSGGWDKYSLIIPAGNGILYAADAQGTLRFFQYDATTGTWSSASNEGIDANWGSFVWAVSGGNGVIFALDSTGALHWFQDLARNGSSRWAAGSRNVIATGWDRFLNVAAGGNGILYAADANGNLQWHRYLANDGSAKWDSASGSVVGQGGWTQFSHLLGGGGGILYPVLSTGEMRWYKDAAQNGTQSWAAGSATAIRQDFTYSGPV